MQQVLSVWSGLDIRRRIVVAGAAIAMFAAVLGLSALAGRGDMALLYAGLEPAAAGEVLTALDQQGTRYEVRGDAVFVPASERDALRLTLAGQGLPANSVQGYELLDSLSGFGTTAQMFDAAYWRAKEGELARTIMAAPDIRAARVHISNISSSPFGPDTAPTASVTVTTAGGGLAARRATALRYLVASAVSGLAPAGVSVIDAASGVVVSGEERAGAAAAEERAATIRGNIERLLEARVGPGNAVVEVSVETVTQREAITETRIDPNSRIAISAETEERSATSTETGGGAVTVASNLPDGDAAADGSSARSQDTETRETVNYEVSETRREILRAPGAIRRLSVAVLVDGIRGTDPATGASRWTPRPAEELEALRELVTSAAGLDPDRGDTITIKSMEFQDVERPEPVAPATGFDLAGLDPMRLIQLGMLAAVALVLGLFVVRPVLAARPLPEGAGASPGLLPPQAPEEGRPAVAGAEDPGSPPGLELPGPALPDLGTPGVNGLAPPDPVPDDPVARLRDLIESRREDTVEILRAWMEEQEQQGEDA